MDYFHITLIRFVCSLFVNGGVALATFAITGAAAWQTESWLFDTIRGLKRGNSSITAIANTALVLRVLQVAAICALILLTLALFRRWLTTSIWWWLDATIVIFWLVQFYQASQRAFNRKGGLKRWYGDPEFWNGRK
ncbi:hypothetical protein [Aliagarivorans marinus]|uniref:hypothetical protein n=1 Tax=Aliagarivorans marinus TaxID=561965 RepID=UPI00047BABB2|nr:hypothetical protein [Aliagarivorans marinus]